MADRAELNRLGAAYNDALDEATDALRALNMVPHAFVGSGPGQKPTTVRGCIVCADCYQPKGHGCHTGIGGWLD